MGIEISVKSKKSIFKKKITEAKISNFFTVMKNELHKIVSQTVLKEFMELTLDIISFTLILKLHPAASGLVLSISKDRHLLAEEKTSSVGPGYHKFIVELLEKLSRILKVEWDWDESLDSTNYYRHKDFSKLKEDWVNLLSLQAVTAKKMGEIQSLVRIDLPLGHIGPRNLSDAGYCAISPTGYWKVDWFTQYLNSSGEIKTEMAREFYPWWNEGFDEIFWKNYGICMIQLEIPWHPPESNELKKYNNTLQAFALAKKIDPHLEIPVAEIEELKKLIKMDEHQLYIPVEEGLGLLKYTITKYVFPSWSMEIPGYFYEQWDNTKRQVQLLNEKRCITATSMVLQIPENRTLTPEELLPPPNVYEQGGLKLHSTIKKENIIGHVFENESFLDLGQFIIQSTLIGKSRMINLTFTIDEDDKEWALQVIDSVHLEA